jgi:hypothetical protein
LFADFQTVAFGAKYAVIVGGFGETQFLETAFEVFPTRVTIFLRGTLGLTLIRAQKDMAPQLADA